MDTTIELTRHVDTTALEQKVKAMYRDVALAPQGEFHFEMGRALAERLGYAPADLDAIPSEAIDSFAGVGYYFDLARLEPGETVVVILYCWFFDYLAKIFKVTWLLQHTA